MNFSGQNEKRSLVTIIVCIVSYAVSAFVLVYNRYHVQAVSLQWTAFGDVTTITFFVLLLCVAVQVPRAAKRGRLSKRRTILVSAQALAIIVLADVVANVQREVPPLGFAFLLLVIIHGVTLCMIGREQLRPEKMAVWMVITFLFIIVSIIFAQTKYVPLKVKDVADSCYDAEIILGAAVLEYSEPSETLRARIKTAYELLASHAVEHVVATGSNARGELSEAAVARRELQKMGVDSAAIIVEDRSRSTLEQILFVRDSLIPLRGWKRFIIVSDQYHLPRALAMCRFHAIDAVGVASRTPLSLEAHILARLRDALALLQYWFFGT